MRRSEKTILKHSVPAVALSIGLTGGALAFGSVNMFGQQAEHEKITRIALSGFGLGPETMDEIAGKRGSYGAVGAPDRLDRGLMNTSEAHCDNGDYLDVPGYPQSAEAAAARLRACRRFIFTALDRAVADAGALADGRGRINTRHMPSVISCVYNGSRGRAKCNVLEALGLAFHAAQDFYAHSNWTDRPRTGPTGPTNPPGLGKSGRAQWLDPRLDVPWPPGLISGCFEGIPEKTHCRYGDGRARVKHRDLNKDTGQIDRATGLAGAGTTERGSVNGNFERAVLAAVDDTRDKWLYFEERIMAEYGRRRGTAIICAVRSDDADTCR